MCLEYQEGRLLLGNLKNKKIINIDMSKRFKGVKKLSNEEWETVYEESSSSDKLRIPDKTFKVLNDNIEVFADILGAQHEIGMGKGFEAQSVVENVPDKYFGRRANIAGKTQAMALEDYIKAKQSKVKYKHSFLLKAHGIFGRFSEWVDNNFGLFIGLSLNIIVLVIFIVNTVISKRKIPVFDI